MLDAVMFTIVSLLIIWILFFDRSLSMSAIIFQDGPLSAVSIFADILIFVVLAIWYLSVKSGRFDSHLYLLLTGTVLYCLTDLYYYYALYKNIYVPNSVTDVVYMASFLLIALGGPVGLYIGKIGATVTGNLYRVTRGRLYKELCVLLVPLLVMAFAGFVLFELLIFLAIVVIYKGLSLYFETSIKKEALLEKERKLSEEQGQIIEQHTQRLLEMNNELRQKNEELNFLSNRDTLTNLYNRRYILDKLERSLTETRSGQIVALLYIDLDRFKVINDTHGHEMGDKVLLAISERLREFSDENVMLARMGGDEFVYVMTGLADSRAVSAQAYQIIERCGGNIYIGDYMFCPSMCIGISVYPLDAGSVSELLKHADIALYHAKEQGENRFSVFSQMIRQKTKRRNAIEILLRGEDILREFRLCYQPQFSLPDKKLIAAEALLRWHNAQLGVIPPAEFIPIAEETDQINKLGIWVLKQAVTQAAAWNRRYEGDLVVGVNISPKQLNSTVLVEELKSLSDSGFNPGWLDIEITESVALEGEYRLAQIFKLFKSIGMSVSIDDFGAGYSSIMSLKQYAFDRIKIAKQLIDSITTSERNEQIVKAIILLAKSIGMKTIAEGVETQAQLSKLSAIGCEQIQGYLLGRPVSADEFESLFMAQPNRAERLGQRGDARTF
jgi:diguanylate cyclase (GGDEF)-like protein